MQVIKPINNDELYIQVDDHLFDELDQFDWYIVYSNKKYQGYLGLNYAVRSKGSKNIFMHKEIAGVHSSDRKKVVTHRDGDTLNNQLSNLRIVSQSQSQLKRRPNFNSKNKYKGVTKQKYNGKFTGKWLAYIQGKYVGTFKTELEAHKAREEYSKEHIT